MKLYKTYYYLNNYIRIYNYINYIFVSKANGEANY